MAYVNTTFLPKTNGMVFGPRLQARADKGRVFGLDATPPPPPPTTIGAVTINPDQAAVAVMGNSTFTAVVTGGDATDLTYKWTVRSGSAQLDTPDDQASATFTFLASGSAQVQCSVSSATASNSPQSNIAIVLVS